MKLKRMLLFVILMAGALLLGSYHITSAKNLKVLAAERESGSIKVLTSFPVVRPYPYIPFIKGQKASGHKLTIPKISNLLK